MFDRNIAEKIWNKLTRGNFEIYLLCVTSVYIVEWHPLYLSSVT